MGSQALKIIISFVGKAELLAEQYEGMGPMPFYVPAQQPGNAPTLVVPSIGDRVRVRMLPGPDIRTLRCTGRLFDFSGEDLPALYVDLDMP